MSELKKKLRKALQGATSQTPVSTATLYKLGTHKQVEAALMELYQAREAACCKIIRKGVETVVWWPVGATGAAHSYGRNGKLCAPKREEARDVHP